MIDPMHRKLDPGKDLERKQLREKIMAAMDELPEDQKQIIVLREIDGMSYKEIAEVLDIPEGTVMSRLFYARKKLQAASRTRSDSSQSPPEKLTFGRVFPSLPSNEAGGAPSTGGQWARSRSE
jgi:predicted RNA polymerase sigma factor